MYLCMYVYMYVCTYVCMYVCMYIPMYVCTYVCMFVCMFVCPVLQLEFKGGELGTAGMMGNNLVLTRMFLVDTSIVINGRNPFLNL